MLKNKIYLLFIFLLTVSCSSGGSDDSIVAPPSDIMPSNLLINIDIIGSDSNNLNGDGSGQISVSFSASNATKYEVKFGDGNVLETTTGSTTHIYSENGLNIYKIEVFAYSSTNHSIGDFRTISIQVSNTGPSLIWSDEFNIEGSPNASNWTYDLGAGGWGNNELQTYTNSLTNARVEDGLLKIIAKAEGSGYTSSRLKSQGLFQFTYGRMDVRAKLPSSAGTWPAIWMLGANFPSVGWPNCGEIDIMEQQGWEKNKVLGTCHWYNTSSSNYAGYGLETTVNNASSQFHIYSIEWDENSIRIFLDDIQYFVMDSGSSSIASSPFQNDFFIILNIAMGGNLGGDIDSNFTEDNMEIDYIRVYQ